MNTTPDRLLNLQQVTEVLGCSATTVRRFIATGTLRSAKVGKLVRVRQSDLDDFIDRMSDPETWGQHVPDALR